MTTSYWNGRGWVEYEYDPQHFDFDGDYPVCRRCGAMVPGTRTHDEWHFVQDQAIKAAAQRGHEVYG